MVSDRDFAIVQKLLGMDTRTAPDKNEVYLLSGIAVCADCGSPMARKVSTVKGKKSCTFKPVDGNRIDGFIQADITQLSDELTKTRNLISRLEEAKISESKSAKGLGEIRKIIFSFPAFIQASAYEEKLSLLSTVIERIIILDHGNEQILR